MKTVKALGGFLLLFILLCSSMAAPAEFLVSEKTAGNATPGTSAEYLAARKMLESGDIISAFNAFSSLGKYEDAMQYANYAFAKLRFLRNDPAEAAVLFAELGDFQDSQYMAKLSDTMNCHRYYDGSRFGYVNGLCEIQIEPQFDWAERAFRMESIQATSADPFTTDELLPVAAVYVGDTICDGTDLFPLEGKYGLIRRDGVLVVPMAFDEILWTLEGLAAVRAGESVELYDLLSGEKIGETYTAAGTYAEGFIPVQKGELWGYVDRAGNLLPGGFLWDSALPFSEGKAGVSQEKLAGFIDTSGSIVIPLEYQAVASFGEGLAGFQQKKKWGFLGASGEVAIKPAYQEVRSFTQGRCAVKRSGKWGAINAEGKFIVRYRYDEITDFDPIYQRAWVRNNKLWGIVALDGTVVLKPGWGTFSPFGADGMSCVSYKGKFGFVDIRGVARIQNLYVAGAPFSADVGGVKTAEGTVEYLSKLGRSFTVDSDYPTQPLNGFIEARQITEIPTVEVNPKTGKEIQGIAYEIAFSLCDIKGKPLIIGADGI